MKLLKKSLLASFTVQLALPSVYLLAAGIEQQGVVLLFPFVVGLPLGPLLLRPFAELFSPGVALNMAMISAFVGNFLVYAIGFQA